MAVNCQVRGSREAQFHASDLCSFPSRLPLLSHYITGLAPHHTSYCLTWLCQAMEQAQDSTYLACIIACPTPGCHSSLRPYPLQSDSESIEPFPLIYFEACSSCSPSKRIESVPFHVPGHGQLECLHALASASPKARIQKLYFHSMMTIRACRGACTRRCTRIKCFELCPKDSCPPQSSLSSTYVLC